MFLTKTVARQRRLLQMPLLMTIVINIHLYLSKKQLLAFILPLRARVQLLSKEY